MTPSLKKRFWTDVTVVEAPGGYSVKLDTFALKTPAKAPLVVPNRAIAEMVRGEWDAVDKELDPEVMPATRAANASIDKLSVNHALIADMLGEYGGTDLLCYRATHPDELIARQAAAWDPILEWAATELSAPLAVTSGILPVDQPKQSVAVLRAELDQFSAFEMSAVHDLVSLSGSLVLGLAVSKNRLAASEVWDISRIDEDFQAELWGQDDEAEEMARVKKAAFLFAEKFLAAARSD